ncbi:MAG: hypothetical protein EBV30_10340 [Actinobacteria bacterium]|nr:hypothetical protein [Actinomycetota bacterium]
MSKPRSPVSLYSHLSAKLREFGELLPTAFQQRSDKAPFPVLELIQKLHDIVWHEQLAPDYDDKTKEQLKQIRTDIYRMVVVTKEAVAICVAPNLIAFHATICGYDESLYRSSQLVISFIRRHLDPLIDAMTSEAGQLMAICIEPYRPWDTPKEPVPELFRELLKPPRAEVKCVVHRCGNPNKEPWPNCCSEASVAMSKKMEEAYFRGEN